MYLFVSIAFVDLSSVTHWHFLIAESFNSLRSAYVIVYSRRNLVASVLTYQTRRNMTSSQQMLGKISESK